MSDGADAVAAPQEPLLVASCANCGAPLTGRYCSACGQEARTIHQPLRGVVADWRATSSPTTRVSCERFGGWSGDRVG